ncbi:DNA-directed RNA polymerase II core subunit [Tulasnella sp. 330]|nr:DNA-directed RNA polymerase II core subunit [Tulasnella sp. 330]KAG8884761.1 DNA-directed RNA polymerase II core subunit [Tulasnella sp. 331]KAG8889862.1 DNA-directed RNA polymerase II core subunit [Tulasnella sp. 332]
MNAPNRFELYVLADGEKALEVVEDTKIPNAATIKIVKQDHTMANMIRAQLLAHPNVVFAGYKVPHPNEPYFILKVQTDGKITPAHAFRTSCELLLATIANLQREFIREFELKSMDEDDAGQGARAGGMTGAYGDAYGSTDTGRTGRPRAHDYADFGM